MSGKSNKFERDLDRLIRTGYDLFFAIQCECDRAGFTKAAAKQMGKEKAQALTKRLPNFKDGYQAWYSEALPLVRQTLPGRVVDFVAYYEYPRVRKETNFQNYMIKDYLQGLEITSDSGYDRRTIVDGSAAIPEFRQQLNIVEAAKSTLSSSLVNLTTILQADLFESEIDSAAALGKAGYLRAAGAICGVVIEKHLKQVCVNHGLTIRRKIITIAFLNETLKAADVLSIPDWRYVQRLADLRNLCDHAKDQEPSKDQVDELVEGTRKILATIL